MLSVCNLSLVRFVQRIFKRRISHKPVVYIQEAHVEVWAEDDDDDDDHYAFDSGFWHSGSAGW